ncbi:hypothetical protein GNZ12_38180 [Paraburkholderia sp. 1N]|uniref:Uncharacterized protein n=1 Tax=Paraburkholderia solitsugae TaxID=2675748 RepID=A0ABX2C3X9_9BURK|nr:hypothetical protein [Paraburkholderia solitsugae]NPT47023.1 hypothetical protein [Paraburkholderia solitsugae]
MTESSGISLRQDRALPALRPPGIVFYPQYFVLFHEVIEDWFNDGLGIDYAGFIGNEKLGILKWIRILYHCWQTRTLCDESVYLNTLRKRGSPLLGSLAPPPRNA